MSKCSDDFCDLVKWTIYTNGAFLLFLVAVAAIAALIGLFIVMLRLPTDLYRPPSLILLKKTVVSLQRFNFKRWI